MTVINKYHHGGNVPHGTVNIMRGTPFGNPYEIGKDGDRRRVLALYHTYLWGRIRHNAIFRKLVRDLHGKTLCCCCKPNDCHGDLLEQAAAQLVQEAAAYGTL